MPGAHIAGYGTAFATMYAGQTILAALKKLCVPAGAVDTGRSGGVRKPLKKFSLIPITGIENTINRGSEMQNRLNDTPTALAGLLKMATNNRAASINAVSDNQALQWQRPEGFGKREPGSDTWKKNSVMRCFALAIIVSMLITALLMSVNYFAVAFQIITFAVSLMAGFIIECMFSGDSYE